MVANYTAFALTSCQQKGIQNINICKYIKYPPYALKFTCRVCFFIRLLS